MDIRNRVIEMKTVKAGDIAANDRNWRLHGDEQREALRAVFGEVGFAGVSLAYYSERNGGKLTLIDGHLRKEEVGADFELPVAITDLTDREADKLLALFDPLGGLASADEAKFAALASEIQTESEAIKDLLAATADVDFAPTDPTPDPNRDFYGERQAHITYSVVFDDTNQQEKWFEFLRALKRRYTAPPTLAGKLIEFLSEHQP